MGWVQYAYNEWTPEGIAVGPLISSSARILEYVLDQIMSFTPDRIISFGISYGANIAAEVSLRRAVHMNILVNPILDYPAYRLRQLGSVKMHAWKRCGQITLNYQRGRLVTSYEFMHEAAEQDLVRRLRASSTPVIIIQGECDETLRVDELIDQLGDVPAVQIITVPDANHRFTDPITLQKFCRVMKPIVGELSRLTATTDSPPILKET